MSSAAPIIPTYSAVALRFAKPLRHGDGLRFVTNPLLLGRDEAPVVFANVMQLNGCYFLSGPAFPAGEPELMRNLVLAGEAAITTYNKDREDAQKIYTAATPAEALSLLWLLLTAHYAIADAAAQVETYALRQATDRNQAQEDYQAALDAAQRQVEICYGREAAARQHHNSMCRQARAAFPLASQEADRKQYSHEAFEALQRAVQNTINAGQVLRAVEANAPPAAAGPVGNATSDELCACCEASECRKEGCCQKDFFMSPNWPLTSNESN